MNKMTKLMTLGLVLAVGQANAVRITAISNQDSNTVQYVQYRTNKNSTLTTLPLPRGYFHRISLADNEYITYVKFLNPWKSEFVVYESGWGIFKTTYWSREEFGQYHSEIYYVEGPRVPGSDCEKNNICWM